MEYIMTEKKGLTLKAFIKELKNDYESCSIHLENEDLTFKMNVGELDSPIHNILLKKKITQVLCKDFDTYVIWLVNNGDTNTDSNLIKNFFLTQYDNLCNKISKTLPEGFHLIYINPYVQCNEIGAYLEIQITNYADYDKISRKYYL